MTKSSIIGESEQRIEMSLMVDRHIIDDTPFTYDEREEEGDDLDFSKELNGFTETESKSTLNLSERSVDKLEIFEKVRFVGQVKWFNTKAGYGFITVCGNNANAILIEESTVEGADDLVETCDLLQGKDIFVHYSSINVLNTQYKYLVQGEYVEFNIVKTENDKYEYNSTNVSGIKGGTIMCETRKTTVPPLQNRRNNSGRGLTYVDKSGVRHYGQVHRYSNNNTHLETTEEFNGLPERSVGKDQFPAAGRGKIYSNAVRPSNSVNNNQSDSTYSRSKNTESQKNRVNHDQILFCQENNYSVPIFNTYQEDTSTSNNGEFETVLRGRNKQKTGVNKSKNYSGVKKKVN
jgi:hypothetical protein